MTLESQMRAQFEVWMKSIRPNFGLGMEEVDGALQYAVPVVQTRWEAWQAAYTAGDRNGRERAAKDEIDWHIVSEAVADAISNAEGQVSAAYLEHAFRKADIGVYHAPDLPVSFGEHTKLRADFNDAVEVLNHHKQLLEEARKDLRISRGHVETIRNVLRAVKHGAQYEDALGDLIDEALNAPSEPQHDTKGNADV